MRLRWLVAAKKSPVALRKKKATKVVAFLGVLIEIVWIARY